MQHLLVRVTFDKPVSRSEAKAAFADSIHGTHYVHTWNDEDASEFTIRGVKPAPLYPNGKPITRSL